ncbi:MAG: hypothetical protein QOF94_1650 [Acidobacteriaceae bacterium]
MQSAQRKSLFPKCTSVAKAPVSTAESPRLKPCPFQETEYELSRNLGMKRMDRCPLVSGHVLKTKADPLDRVTGRE